MMHVVMCCMCLFFCAYASVYFVTVVVVVVGCGGDCDDLHDSS